MRVRTALPPLVTAALLLPLLPSSPAAAASLAPRVLPAAGLVAPGLLTGSGRSDPSVVPEVRRSSLRAGSASAAGASRFTVTYTGFSPAQRDAFQAAVDTWARVLSSPVPITIDARLEPLPHGVLGSAGPTDVVVRDANGRYDAEDTVQPIALANALAGRDLQPATADITADFSNDTSVFSYGPTPDPGKYDFTTVVLHEIAHGLGFAGAMDVVPDTRGTVPASQ